MSSTLWFALAFAIAVVAAWLGWSIWAEAYGSGPPYYGRTTNMDKWSSPVSTLIILGLVATALVALCCKLGLRAKS